MKNPLKPPLLYGIAAFLLSALVFVSISRSVQSNPAMQEQTHTYSELGKGTYETYCAPCHGSDGKGNGMFAINLDPKPRDFTQGVYKFRSTANGSIPLDDNLAQTINRGLHGSSMPAMQDILTGDTLRAVIQYIKSFSNRFIEEKPQPVTVSTAIPYSEQSVAEGKLIYEKLECSGCHGTDGAQTGAIATELIDNWGNPTTATNLTEPWTFRGGSSQADIFLRLKTGVDGTPMPSYAESASDRELWNLSNYVISIARKPLWQMSAEEVQRHFSKQEQAVLASPVERGKYLINSMGCVDCHSPYKEGRRIMEEFRMAGGAVWKLGPYGDFVSPNLTSDKETGIGNWTDAELKNALTKGIRKDGRRMLPFPMPWTSYSNLSDSDLNAMIAYLRTLPPIHNKIPEHESPGIFTYLWGKFEMLILKKDFYLGIYPGNAGSGRPNAGTLPEHVQTNNPTIAEGKER